jgi:hypothetical protein
MSISYNYCKATPLSASSGHSVIQFILQLLTSAGNIRNRAANFLLKGLIAKTIWRFFLTLLTMTLTRLTLFGTRFFTIHSLRTTSSIFLSSSGLKGSPKTYPEVRRQLISSTVASLII